MKDNILVRTLTGAVFLAVMISGMLWDDWSLRAVFTLVTLGCFYEYLRLMRVDSPFQLIIAMLAAAILWAGTSVMDRYPFAMSVIPLALLLIFLLPVWSKKVPLKFIRTSIMGYAWIILPFLCLIWMTQAAEDYETGSFILLGYFIVIWVNDIMAYLTGKFFGKHKIAPHISPGKSWEGFAGGLVFALGAGVANYYLFGIFALYEWIILAFITAILAVQSDLFQSRVKRQAGVKDSGKLLPGHGGLLDRFDSVLLSAPVVLVIVVVSTKY